MSCVVINQALAQQGTAKLSGRSPIAKGVTSGALKWHPSLLHIHIRSLLRRERAVASAAFDSIGPSSMSPFELMDRQMAAMDRDMARMMQEPFGFPPSASTAWRQMDQDLANMQRQLDAELADTFARARRVEADAKQVAERAVQEGGPNVRVQREERSGPGSYYRYESIQVVSSGPRLYYTPAAEVATQVASPFSPLLLGLAILTGAYATVAAKLLAKWEETRYKDESRWRLVPAWPFLAAFSENFRAEVLRVLGLEGKKKAAHEQADK